MKTHIQLKKAHYYALPPEYQNDDVRMPDSLVEYLLTEFTREGDLVFDPFAGYGTTLFVAEAMKRIGYGVEYIEGKAKYIQSNLSHPEHLIHGDSRKLSSYNLPKFDFCMTSPPYTPREDTENPFTAYTELGNTYENYLQDISHIYKQVAQCMRPSAKVVIEIANLKTKHGVTTLAWDVANAVSRVMTFEGEIVIGWDEYGYGYDHSYCLVFSNKDIHS